MNRLAFSVAAGVLLLVVYFGVLALSQNPYLAVAGLAPTWIVLLLWSRRSADRSN